MRVVHIGTRSAFVDFLVGYFEQAAPGDNSVVRLPSPAGTGGPVGTARAAVGYAGHLIDVARRARGADVVVAHMLTLPSAIGILASRPTAFTIWSGWGVDYYPRGADATHELLGPLTRALSGDLDLDRAPRGGRAVQALTRWLTERAVRRADAFSAPIPDDLDVMRRNHPGFRGTYHQLNYADMSSFSAQATSPAGADILLGNSAWPANNHLEAIDRLSRLDLTGRTVFTPLTYGDRRYRDAVLAQGRRLLGDAFEPLLEPLPHDAYVERVGRCGIVVMNHHRQQGLGNVGIGLLSGAHLYLSRANPLHGFLTRIGLDVNAVETMTALPDAPVSAEALTRRHAIMRRIWGEDVVLDNVRSVLAAAGRATGA